MQVVVIIHSESEGWGTVGDFLQSLPVDVAQTRLYAGDQLPEDLSKVKAVISMGGHMNVYQEEEFPFLAHETVFLQKALRLQIPIFGICLGAQMVAKACGVPVTLASAKERGWTSVSLTREGVHDPLFNGLAGELLVFQWHEDSFQIPNGGVLLATSATCRNQAFRYGNAYGIQFHPEVTREIILDWSKESEARERETIMQRFEEVKDHFFDQAMKLYSNFAIVAGLCGQVESPVHHVGR